MHLQVAPAELEGLLINHPGIDDVGILGVPDKEAGELPKALIVKKPGKNVTKEEIHAYVDGIVNTVVVISQVVGIIVGLLSRSSN